jgi:hypothetical protein
MAHALDKAASQFAMSDNQYSYHASILMDIFKKTLDKRYSAPGKLFRRLTLKQTLWASGESIRSIAHATHPHDCRQNTASITVKPSHLMIVVSAITLCHCAD